MCGGLGTSGSNGRGGGLLHVPEVVQLTGCKCFDSIDHKLVVTDAGAGGALELLRGYVIVDASSQRHRQEKFTVWLNMDTDELEWKLVQDDRGFAHHMNVSGQSMELRPDLFLLCVESRSTSDSLNSGVQVCAAGKPGNNSQIHVA